MTYTVKLRGSSSAPIAADYMCETCGPFETIVARPAPDEIPCDQCAAPATWLPCAPRIKHPLFVSCHRGKADEKPYPEACDTEPLADGMPLHEWKKRRAEMWNAHDYAEFKRNT